MKVKAIRVCASAVAALAIACAAVPAAAQGNGVGSPFELAYWQAVADSGDAAQFEAYLAQYPQGTFAAIARLRVVALRGGAPVANAQALAPLPPADPAPAAVRPALPPALAAAPLSPTTAPAPAPAADLIARARAFDAGAAPGAVTVDLPPTPQLAQVPPVPIPPSFCSALERNAYHDDVYRPARAVAQDNNRAAITHLRALQELYDSYAPARDFERMNIIADAARAYEPVADDSYNVTVSYDTLFDRLMTVRIVDCEGAL